MHPELTVSTFLLAKLAKNNFGAVFDLHTISSDA